MKLAPTASRSALLLQCSWPFGRELPPEERSPARDEAASYGLDFHAAMDGKKVRRKKKIAKGVIEHAKEATAKLEAWLKREGWAACVTERESSYAIDPRYGGSTGPARPCAPPDEETHVYPDQRPGEIAGTADRIVMRRRHNREYLIIDYKTGADDEGVYARPSALPQLLTLGLAVAGSDRGHTPITVQHAVLHAPRDASPVLYADPPMSLGSKQNDEHRHRLAMALDRIGDGSMRPGSECKYCPAREACPTRGATLLERADGLLHGLALRQSQELFVGNDRQAVAQNGDGAIEGWDARLGRLYAMTKLAEDTAKEIRKRLAEERKKGALPVIPDEDWVPILVRGKVLDFRTVTYRNLSMKGLERQLGKKAAEREIKRLEKLGAIEKVERTDLYPMDD
jgi:PD-(D/E)XK nuclease superfamily